MLAGLKVAPDHERMRLDVFVSSALGPEYTRSQVARMIKAGLVTVNGAPRRVPRARCIRATVSTSPIRRRWSHARCHRRALYRRAVCRRRIDRRQQARRDDGASGARASRCDLVDALLARFPELATMAEAGGVLRPGIVHRLDKETSGVMVVARTPFAKAALSAQFKARTVKKIYLAIVRGIVARDRVTIERALGRHPTDRKRMSVHSHNCARCRQQCDRGRAHSPDARRDPGDGDAGNRPHSSDKSSSRIDRASVSRRYRVWWWLEGQARRRSGRRISASRAARDESVDRASAHARAPTLLRADAARFRRLSCRAWSRFRAIENRESG